MKTIIVTGATSFIGVHLIKEYLNHDCKVIAVVRPNSRNLNRLPKSKNLQIIESDMEKIETIKEKVKDIKLDVFYHLAWEGARVPYRDDANLQKNNYECAIKAMNVAKELGGSIFIGSGSQAEYGKCIGKIDESYPTNPTTEYGKAKLKAYETLKKMAKESNIKFIWTRIFSVYGIYDYSGTLVMSALNKMKKNENILLTECIQNWDFIYVEDAARIMYLLANTECVDGVYNIASGESRKLKEFVMEMKEIVGSDSELQFGVVPYNSEGVVSFEPVIDKLRTNLKYSYQISFNEGIKKILKFLN